MKVKCPNCNYEWDNPLHAAICPNKVAITQSTRMQEIFDEINKKSKRGKFAQKVFSIIESLQGQEISAKQISNILDVSQYTDNDLIRTILDFHICIGQLKKTRYKKGRGGHRWVFTSISQNSCPYWDELKHGCLNKNWIKVEEGEEK